MASGHFSRHIYPVAQGCSGATPKHERNFFGGPFLLEWPPLLWLFEWLEECSESAPGNGSSHLPCGLLLPPTARSGGAVLGCFRPLLPWSFSGHWGSSHLQSIWLLPCRVFIMTRYPYPPNTLPCVESTDYSEMCELHHLYYLKLLLSAFNSYCLCSLPFPSESHNDWLVNVLIGLLLIIIQFFALSSSSWDWVRKNAKLIQS